MNLLSFNALSKTFCLAGEGDIQDHTSAQNILAGILLHTTHYYTKNANVFFSAELPITQTIPSTVLGRNTDKMQVMNTGIGL